MQAECSDIFQRLESWYARESGQYLYHATERAVQDMLDRAFGYHILQLGHCSNEALCANSPINHRIVCAARAEPGVQLVAHPDELPLESDSVDAVIAHHSLEFACNPHQVLREIQRVLTPQGQLLVIGFNPYSLAGCGSYLRRLAGHSLWRHHRPVGERRMTDWLHLLGCEVQETVRIHSVPPVGVGRLRRGLTRLDTWSDQHNLLIGGLYILHATKKVAGLHRPRRLNLSRGRPLIGLVPKPAAAPSPIAPSPPRVVQRERGDGQA
ncbi:MAG: hypothetical protein Hals2KO_01850 [Halioglobus sp.]